MWDETLSDITNDIINKNHRKKTANKTVKNFDVDACYK